MRQLNLWRRPVLTIRAQQYVSAFVDQQLNSSRPFQHLRVRERLSEVYPPGVISQIHKVAGWRMLTRYLPVTLNESGGK